jgi:uncharacterized protein (TIGR02301 family)
MSRRVSRLAPAALAFALASSAAAQDAAQPDPPYQPRLERLAETLGALHHLRPLCRPEEGDSWRQSMTRLLEAEQPPAERRDRLVAAFNRGLAGPRETHRTCTPATRAIADRYRDEAAGIARDLARRFAD